MSENTNNQKTLVVFTSYPWDSVLVYLRFRAPAEMAGWQVLPGHDGKNVFVDRIANADVVLIQRDQPRFTKIYHRAISVAREQQKPIVYEIDDWLLGVPDDHPFQSEYVAVLNDMVAAMLEADFVIASTEVLKGKISSLGVDVRVWPNFLPDQYWNIKHPREISDQVVVKIGYMGTSTHLPDLEMVAPVLLELLDHYKERIQIHFWGVQPPEKLLRRFNVFWEAIDIENYPDFVEFFSQQIADIWIAPLEDTPFNRCKSAIKYLEYGALGGAGVYSSIAPYEAVIVDGENGLLAASSDEWLRALKLLIDDPIERSRIAEGAEKDIKEKWLLKNHISEWETIFDGVPSKAAIERKTQSNIFHEMSRQVDRHIRRHKQKIEILESKNRTLSQQIVDLQLRSMQLDEILASRSWRLMQFVQRIRLRLVPQDGTVERLLRSVMVFLQRILSGQEVVSTQVPAAEYTQWQMRNEPGEAGLLDQRQATEGLSLRPLISIVTPVFNTQLVHLEAMIDSVRAQTYSNWELCLVDGNSSKPEIRPALEKAVRTDDRIRVQFLPENRGISENSNVGLAMTQGEFVAFLDHDDTLAPFALYEIVRAINQNPRVDLVYSDYDLLTEAGDGRFSPLFKPDWSPEIMLSANYVTHLTVVRKALIDRVGGFHPDFDGAQDWDLFLRVTEKTEDILHIPQVLYHWRDSGTSTARDIWQKSYAPQAQLEAIKSHLARRSFTSPQAFFDPSGFIRVKWAYNTSTKVSIIIPSNGFNDLLARCVKSIQEKTHYPNYEVIIVNNGDKHPDTFPAYAQLQEDQRIRIVHDERQPFNYSAVNNWGVTHASGDMLVFLNNDTAVVAEDWLDEFVMWATHPEIGAVGAKLFMPDKTIQHAGVILGLTGFAGHVFAGLREGRNTIFGLSEWYRNYLAMTAACLGMERSLFEKVGGFNEDLVLCGNDVELCFRVRDAGYRNLYNPFIKLLHEESATREGPIPAGDYRVSYECYKLYLQSGDPYYNPNLSLWSLIPRLKNDSEIEPDQFALDLLGKLKV